MQLLLASTMTLASILSSITDSKEEASQSVIATHISPAIAGQWEFELDTPKKPVQLSPQEATTQAKQDGVAQSQLELPPNLQQAQIHLQETQRILSATDTQSAHNNTCRELYNFGADNIVWSVSGKEWTYGKYSINYPETGLPIIGLHTLYDNNEVDCSGNQIDQSGETMFAFLKHQDNIMQWCSDSEGKKCHMTFHRVLP